MSGMILHSFLLGLIMCEEEIHYKVMAMLRSKAQFITLCLLLPPLISHSKCIFQPLEQSSLRPSVPLLEHGKVSIMRRVYRTPNSVTNRSNSRCLLQQL
jgi:hypothetical protein